MLYDLLAQGFLQLRLLALTESPTPCFLLNLSPAQRCAPAQELFIFVPDSPPRSNESHGLRFTARSPWRMPALFLSSRGELLIMSRSGKHATSFFFFFFFRFKIEGHAPLPALVFPGQRVPRLLLGSRGTDSPRLTISEATNPLWPVYSLRTASVTQRKSPKPPALQNFTPHL